MESPEGHGGENPPCPISGYPLVRAFRLDVRRANVDRDHAVDELGAGLRVDERELVVLGPQPVPVDQVVRRAGAGDPEVVRHDRVENLVQIVDLALREVVRPGVPVAPDAADGVAHQPVDAARELVAAAGLCLDGGDHVFLARP